MTVAHKLKDPPPGMFGKKIAPAKDAASMGRKQAISKASGKSSGQIAAIQVAGMKALPTEDSKNGFWDAKKRGNGKGRSFYDVNGKTTFMDGKPAPAPASFRKK